MESDNYPKRWEADIKEGCQILKKFIISIGKPVDITISKPGDLILLERDWIVSVST
jgi:hypothetical protein